MVWRRVRLNGLFEATPVVCSFQPGSRINQEDSDFDVVFLHKLREKHLCESGCKCVIQLNVQEPVGRWIDRCIQPVLVSIDPDHSLVECDLGRTGTVFRRKSAL